MFRFHFEVKPEQAQFSRAFSRWADQVDDWTEAFEAIADSFYEGQKQQFASEGATGSGGWKPLSPAYAERKAREFPGRPILTATGEMRGSLESRGGMLSHFRLEKRRLELGTLLDRATYHQEGAGNLPQRKVIELTDRQKDEWTKLIHQHAVAWRGLSGRDYAELGAMGKHFGSI